MTAKEELNERKAEGKALNNNFAGLSADELNQVSGGRYVSDDDVIEYQKAAEIDARVTGAVNNPKSNDRNFILAGTSDNQ